jgi:hypothetical protein
MYIRLADITKHLEAILNSGERREDVSAWAHSAMQAHDKNTLIFLTPKDEQAIWYGLQYLVLVDAREPDQSYVYDEVDIAGWFHKLKPVL